MLKIGRSLCSYVICVCMHTYINSHNLHMPRIIRSSSSIQWSLMVHSLRTNLIYHYCLTLNRLYDFMCTHIIHAYRYIWSTHQQQQYSKLSKSHNFHMVVVICPKCWMEFDSFDGTCVYAVHELLYVI